MSKAEIEEILAFLQNDAMLRRNHYEILLRQKAALIACDRREFQELQDRYEALSDQLHRQDEIRKRLFSQQEHGVRAMIKSWPQHFADQAEKLRQLLIDLACKIKTQAEQNQHLMQNELRFVEFELDLLLSAVRKSPYYIKSGTLEPVSQNRLLNQVA